MVEEQLESRDLSIVPSGAREYSSLSTSHYIGRSDEKRTRGSYC